VQGQLNNDSNGLYVLQIPVICVSEIIILYCLYDCCNPIEINETESDLIKCLSLPVLAMIFLGDLDHSIASTGEDSTFWTYSNKATCIVGQ
jgi:hypothetical protein